MTDILRIPVQPSRLAWNIAADGKARKEGDICASYSGDRIAEGKPIREPFEWQMSLCVCVSLSGAAGQIEAQAYRMIPAQFYNGRTTTYAAKTGHDSGETARADPLGFYDGMVVACGNHRFVMVGEPVIFFSNSEPQRPEDAVQEQLQLGLFS